MASVRSTIDLIITGATRGLGAASAEAEAMARRVADAEDRVSAARTRSAAAEERVGVAERRLQDARSGQEAALSRIGVAETNLDRVRENSNGATTRLARAQADLDAVRNRSGATAEEVARAEGRVNQVRTESDRAAQALQRAEAQLATARANGERAGGRVTAAEAALARARSDNIRASEASARAENDLNNLRRRGNQDVDTQRSGILGLFDAFSRLSNALTGADDAANRFLSTGAALGNLLGTFGGPIAQVVQLVLAVVVAMAAWGEIIGVVGGLIGQALGGAIPVILALGAAAGTAVIGMQNFADAVGDDKGASKALAKLAPNARAAALVFRNDLKPALHDLQQAVQNSLFDGMSEVFKQLAIDVPKLTANFQDIAGALANVFSKLVGVISTTAGMERLQLVLAGTADFVLALGSGIARFLQGLIAVGAAAAPAMAQLGDALGSIFGKLGDVFNRLAGDGTIQKLIVGLAATIKGLGDVLAPVVEILLRMGAALGVTVGSALTELGRIIGSTTPFFEHLAFVAGDLLKSAFEQLGPPIERLFGGTIPDANAAMDQFAGFIKDTVLPALGHFIDFIRTDAIPGFKAFALGIAVNVTEAASAILGFVSASLGALEELALFLFKMTGDQKFLDLAGAAEVAKRQVDGFKQTMDGLHDKSVKLLVQGADTGFAEVHGLNHEMTLLHDRTVATTSTVNGTAEVKALVDRQAEVKNKTVATTSNVPEGPNLGTLGNKTLTGAIGAVIDKTTVTTGKVPEGPTLGTLGNQRLGGAMDALHDKTVTATARISGLDGIEAMRRAIDSLHDKTVSVGVNFTGSASSPLRAAGGPIQAGQTTLVGERGPEFLTLPRSGMITNTERSRHIAGEINGGGGGPITVNVLISPDRIADIARVEITNNKRTTRRTVSAGSGITF